MQDLSMENKKNEWHGNRSWQVKTNKKKSFHIIEKKAHFLYNVSILLKK